MTLTDFINLSYLVAAALFIFGLKRLSSPATARSGNILGATGMLIAIVVTLVDRQVVDYTGIVAGVVVGAAIGAVLARTTQRTAMPQMGAMFNGLGGGASALVAAAEFSRLTDSGGTMDVDVALTIMLGTFIGAVTFSGSLVAFGKLQDLLVPSRAINSPIIKTLNPALFLGAVAMTVFLVVLSESSPLFPVLIAVSLVLGVFLVLPIGGADMPVVIALLNSYSGLAAAATGFVLDNMILIIAGSLVGASGLILTNLMCKAMNRSIWNVMFGAFGSEVAVVTPTGTDGRHAQGINAEEAAVVLAYARSVIFVPGYGLAAAQAQHQTKELADLLQARGVEVRYAIHPVAGRMPGHMNVLLAEAEVPYDQLYAMEDINDDFDRTDVAVVVGANDVTNPAARDTPDSPIYGMPILNVDRARNVIFIKRSLSPGFAGIDNDLFYNPKTRMFFADAKRAMIDLANAIKDLH
ncbi:MAG: NAD(P)(+) transhydrogenase (Re/Si-specific) subunit beta [Chloroflexi bacterium]|nr:NAD(P)(+) transhydrogenase (Re/Si-specific) subunit beta [Chloroflexota bacterium]